MHPACQQVPPPHPSCTAPIDHLVEVQLGVSPLQHALLHTAACHQAVHVHRLGLADAVHARHGLCRRGHGGSTGQYIAVQGIYGLVGYVTDLSERAWSGQSGAHAPWTA
jgi:hypothetical protein